MKPVILAVGCAISISAALAASTSVRVGEQTLYLGTGTADGRCNTREVDKGVRETVCRDGANVAALSTEAGCLDSMGKGYCTVGAPRPAGVAGSQLTCAQGVSYSLSVGAEATCRLSGDSKTCTAADGSQATADCRDGCGNTKGAGGCCQVGSTGCPPQAKRG
jgi:hypothetical protein